MTYIDVHCHIDMYSDEKIEQVIEGARKNNVDTIIVNGVNVKTNRRILKLADKYTEIKVALGIDPIDALKLTDQEVEDEINFIKKNKGKIIAIGEVGIDLKWSKELKAQKENFEKFIQLSIDLDKPIIVHSRNAEHDVLDMLDRDNCKKVIVHCFNGKLSLVDKAIKNGWYFSIPTNITYSEQMQKLVDKLPITNILCETDSPYLHPQKGQRNNTPVNVIEGYKKISEIKDMNLKVVEEKIKENYKRLFVK
ncbi:TatD family hydrolase [Candidatus Pacearchaeota archaeon]|nr:TatD family hydrolase [Candidatus Pacearchaeota archaeon]